MDNTNWKAGWTGEPCFQMKNVNCRRDGGLHRRQKGGLHKTAGCGKEGGLLCSPLACPVVQPAGLPFCAACQPAENSFGNTARPALCLVLSHFFVIPTVGSRGVVVMCHSCHTDGFRFDSHLSDFYFFKLFFRLACHLYELVLG